jgi:hypothetical protein
MKKWTFALVVLTAIIRSSKVRDVILRHGIHEIRLCANFDILKDGKTIERDFQCSNRDWAEIEKGIQIQLQNKQADEDANNAEANRIRHLYNIKNDEIGKVIR